MLRRYELLEEIMTKNDAFKKDKKTNIVVN